MRRLLLPLVVVVPLAAQAQTEGLKDKARERLADDPAPDTGADLSDDSGSDDSGGGSDDSGGSDSDGGDEPSFGGRGGKASREGGDSPSSAPESYTVQTGDTLWNLSQRFLNNPWYWPKIWSYNPQLDNPNWIRPGTVLRFYPGSDAPVDVKPQEPEDEEPNYEDVGEGGGFEVGKDFNERVAVQDTRRREFFIPSDKLDDAGQILNSPEEKRWLATDDRAYVKLKKGNPGDVFQIFRKERELRHPVTGATVGTIVTMVGEVRVDQTGKEQALGTVVSTWDPIERGYYVANLPVTTDPVRRVENSKNVKGYVVDAAPAPLSFMAESYMAVVDKGSADGVQVGNTFTIVRAGDPYTKEYSGMPDEEVGEIIIVETFKNSATGMLTAASRVIVPGDRVEMRTK
jgi:hypothetical protein